MTKAFLSHTSADKDLVERIQKILTEKNAWYDAVNIENGESIPERINEGLRTATHYVLFWSQQASQSSWVRAELNAAFVIHMESKCKFLIFTLDETPLPELLQPYKYSAFNKSDLSTSANQIADIILAQVGVNSKLSSFVNRTKELGTIEDFARKGYKLIVLNGILGIGKSSLAEKALEWLYPNNASKRILLDFSTLSGTTELILELSRKVGMMPFHLDNYSDKDKHKELIQYLLELLSQSKNALILKDIKSWLNEDGSLSDNLKYLTDVLIHEDFFDGITIATSSRFVELPNDYFNTTYQLTIKGMDNSHIENIIKNNLPSTFDTFDDKKNKEFASILYGYPLGAKIGANNIACHGYDYFLQQKHKIESLKIGLAKNLISHAELSEGCITYLKIMSLAKSKMRNNEYAQAFPDLEHQIPKFSDEAYFAGILKFDDDGCYKLEPIVEDYFYDLAFNSPDRSTICKKLEVFLTSSDFTEDATLDKRLRLLPVTIHILTLTGHFDKAKEMLSLFSDRISDSMWDQYNHQDYDEALNTANQLLLLDSKSSNALYVKALCLTRNDKYTEAENILIQLLSDNADNPEEVSRYHYALGRIQKRQSNYDAAIELFDIAILKNSHYLSPHREKAECFIYLNELNKAQNEIAIAKTIDDTNIFIILLEAHLLQKLGRESEAISLLSSPSVLYSQNQSQVLFRLGRIYDQCGDIDKACEQYTRALEHNPKMYDAKLCLLSHQILDKPAESKEIIFELKPKLNGKRKAILTNIEARLIGYINHDILTALSILDTVKTPYRDKQWYAVKLQLLENLVTSYRQSKHNRLATECQKEFDKNKEFFESHFGKVIDYKLDILPDA